MVVCREKVQIVMFRSLISLNKIWLVYARLMIITIYNNYNDVAPKQSKQQTFLAQPQPQLDDKLYSSQL